MNKKQNKEEAKKSASLKPKTTKPKNGGREIAVPPFLIFIPGALLLITAIIIAYAFFFTPDRPSSIDDVFTSDNVEFRHPLTGEPIEQEMDDPDVFAVMIENSSDSWPQAGIEDAFLVIEAPVEGWIPRLLAFFDASVEIEKIGPVRSARPYFIDWANMFNPLYVHVGGSPAALEILRVTDSVLDLNEFFHQYQFWRSSYRSAPHNVYTSSELLLEGLEKFGEQNPDYAFFSFEEQVTIPVVDEISVDFGLGYESTWMLQEDGEYLRYQNSAPHLMESGVQLITNNILVLEMEMYVIDNIGRIEMETIGEGSGYLFTAGGVRELIWEKESEESEIVILDKENETDIHLNPGVTWIEVVNSLEDDLAFNELEAAL